MKFWKRLLSMVLCFALVIGTLPIAPAMAASTPSTNWHDYDGDNLGALSTTEITKYVKENIKVENGTLYWPSLADIPYSGNSPKPTTSEGIAALTRFVGSEIYLYQDYNSGKPYALTGVNVDASTTSISLADLAAKTGFDADLTFGGVVKDGWKGGHYNSEKSYYIILAIERGGNGFATKIDELGPFNLGDKDNWGKYMVNLGNLPDTMTTDGNMKQYVSQGSPMVAVTIRPAAGYSFDAWI